MGDVRDEIRSSEDELWRRVLDHVRYSQRWQFWTKLILIMLGGTISVVGGLLEKPQPGTLPWKYILGIGGGLMVFVGGILLLFIEYDSPELLKRMRSHLDTIRRYLDERDAMVAQEGWREQCSVALAVVTQAVETALQAPTASAKLAVQALLEVACDPLLLALRINIGEDWTISVFRRTPTADGEEMVRIAQRWKDEPASKIDVRTWKRRQGYTGEAWDRNKPLFEADTSTPSARERYEVPPDKLYAEGNPLKIRSDEKRYRSIAALPVRVGGDEQPWGILVATSDQANRFDADDRTAGGANKTTLRHLAASIALIAATKKGD